MERCDNCQFWTRWAADERGLCRRNPPRVHTDLLQTLVDNYGFGEDTLIEAASQCTLWPMTLETQWCGEFQPETED